MSTYSGTYCVRSTPLLAIKPPPAMTLAGRRFARHHARSVGKVRIVNPAPHSTRLEPYIRLGSAILRCKGISRTNKYRAAASAREVAIAARVNSRSHARQQSLRIARSQLKCAAQSNEGCGARRWLPSLQDSRFSAELRSAVASAAALTKLRATINHAPTSASANNIYPAPIFTTSWLGSR